MEKVLHLHTHHTNRKTGTYNITLFDGTTQATIPIFNSKTKLTGTSLSVQQLFKQFFVQNVIESLTEI